MLDYSFFYDLAKYCNDTWKGCFTEKEIAENAYEYLVSYEDITKVIDCNDLTEEMLTTS